MGILRAIPVHFVRLPTAPDTRRAGLQMILENLRTDMEWREKTLRRQVEIATAKMEAEALARLKAERALKQEQV
jgi:hypothetical protein